MSVNPYQSPSTGLDIPVSRRRANRLLRIATVILYFPAAANFAALIDSNPSPSNVQTLYHVVNAVWLVIGFLLIWTFGLPLVDRISGFLRHLFARECREDAWRDVLFQSFTKLPVLAAMGAVLWLLWVYGFYFRGWNFYVLSWAIGVPAHLLAAYWYVPLVYRWFLLARTGNPDSPASRDASGSIGRGVTGSSGDTATSSSTSNVERGS